MWERGISVVPVPRPSKRHDGKRPVMRWAEYQNRRATYGEMRRWFEGDPTNYAVITGRVSGIVVVDIDDRTALPWARWNLEETPWTVATSRGFHWYFRYPGAVGNRAKVAGMKLDVRGDGGYVIGPGSIHSSGAVYSAHDRRGWHVPKSRLPALDPSILVEPKPPREQRALRIWDAPEERGRRYLAKIPRPSLGFGSDAATFIAACRLVRGFNLRVDQAVALLSDWQPLFDTWWLKTKVDAALRYGTETTGSKL